MKSLKVGLIIIGICCLFQESAQEVISAEEKSMGQSIANKLNSLMRPKFAGSGRAFRGLKRASLQRTYLDLQILLDSSGSIGASEFKKAKSATMIIVDFVNSKSTIKPGGSRVAFIEFSSKGKTKLVFGLGDRDYVADVKSAINQVNYDHGSATATALALSKARNEFVQSGGNTNAKVVWILTDGKSNTGGSPIPPASQLKSMGVTICAVGVGNSVNMAEINAIASSGCVYKTTSFSSYKRAMTYALKVGGGGSAPVLNPNFFSGIKF